MAANQTAAMDRLRADLAEARAIYDGRDKTPAGESGQIAGAVNAIAATVTFLRNSGVSSEYWDPLLIVLAAFRDHNLGKPHPLFCRKKRTDEQGKTLSSGKSNPAEVNTWRGVAASLLHKVLKLSQLLGSLLWRCFAGRHSGWT